MTFSFFDKKRAAPGSDTALIIIETKNTIQSLNLGSIKVYKRTTILVMGQK